MVGVGVLCWLCGLFIIWLLGCFAWHLRLCGLRLFCRFVGCDCSGWFGMITLVVAFRGGGFARMFRWVCLGFVVF